MGTGVWDGGLRGKLMPTKSKEILVIGCGNSALPADLAPRKLEPSVSGGLGLGLRKPE